MNVSIPTVFDPSLAPRGKHLIHAYTGKPLQGQCAQDNTPAHCGALLPLACCCRCGAVSSRPLRGSAAAGQLTVPLHVLPAAGNEPYELWEGVKRGTPEYAALKVGTVAPGGVWC